MNTIKQANLMLHCGAKSATLEEIEAVPTPEGTDTHFPIPHSALLQTVEEALANAQLPVVHQQFALSDDQQRLFGLMQVDAEAVLGHQSKYTGEYGTIFAVRNSHDKSFAATLGIGAHCFICDNLAFHMDLSLSRRHTRFIMEDLPGVAQLAMGRLVADHKVHEERLEAYSSQHLSRTMAARILMQCRDTKAMSGQQVWRAWDEHKDPSYPEFCEPGVVDTFLGLYQAITHSLKPTEARQNSGRTALFDLPTRTTKVCGIMDLACHFAPSGVEQPVLRDADAVVEGALRYA